MSNANDEGPTGALEIFVLGRSDIRVDGVSVDDGRWPRRASRQLVKILALAPRNQLHREQLIDHLWPEGNAGTASNNLNKALHAARRALEPDLATGEASRFLVTSDQLVVLAAPTKLWIDAEAFRRRAERALASGSLEMFELARSLYTGDLLPEDLYSDWAATPRAHLAELYAELLSSMAARAQARGRHELAVQLLLEMVARDPSNEGAYRSLMHIYALTGHRDQSFRQFERCRSALREHLGVRPDRATTELYERILSGAVRPVVPAIAARAQASDDRRAEVERREDAESAPHNLPRQVARFVGREQEVTELRRALRETALLTLIGPGGMGKTRLALEAAAGQLAEFPDGVWFVEVGRLVDPIFLAETVAETLRVRETPGQSIRESLVEFLSTRCALLIVDGGEHLVDACARLVTFLLRRCPKLVVLFTSREAMRIPGETVRNVPPLETPPVGARHGVADAVRYDAVRLFVDRAAPSNPSFALTDRTAGAVAELCAKLDGLPLAIELAAARLTVLSVEQMLERLTDRIRVLDITSRGGEARHHTLRTTLDWSHALLDDREKALFRRTAAFSGSWSLAAAESVCTHSIVGTEEVLEVLARLVSKSLVVAVEASTEVRYRMLETIRLYAFECLRESGELDALTTRHRDWYAALASEAERELRGPDQEAWLDRLASEHDNLRAILRSPDDSDGRRTLGLCVALMRFWTVRGHWTEGIASIEYGLSLPGPSEPNTTRAHALYTAGTLARLQANAAKARDYLERSLAEWRALGDRPGMATATNQLGFVALSEYDVETAERLAHEALGIYRETGDRFGAALVLIQLANIASELRRHGEGKRYLEESLEYFRTVGDRLNVGIVLHSLGEITMREGRYAEAERLFEESLATTDKLEYRLLQALSTVSLGYIVLERREFSRARPLFERALRIAEELGDRETLLNAVAGLAAIAAVVGSAAHGVLLHTSVESHRAALGIGPDPSFDAIATPVVLAASNELNSDELAAARLGGRGIPFAELADRATGD